MWVPIIGLSDCKNRTWPRIRDKRIEGTCTEAFIGKRNRRNKTEWQPIRICLSNESHRNHLNCWKLDIAGTDYELTELYGVLNRRSVGYEAIIGRQLKRYEWMLLWKQEASKKRTRTLAMERTKLLQCILKIYRPQLYWLRTVKSCWWGIWYDPRVTMARICAFRVF